MPRPSIAIVGAGRVGVALAQRLAQAGYRVKEIISRNSPRSLSQVRQLARMLKAKACTSKSAQLDADLVWFCVPDAKLAEVANGLSKRDWIGKIAFHSSGVLLSDVLEPLHKRGASTASVHPLMTFIPGSSPRLAGVTFAVEGETRAVRAASGIIANLGGKLLRIRKPNKVAYHAFATMTGPLLVSLLASSEKTARLAGISVAEARRGMMPIVHQALANYQKSGAAAAFTGPLVRGDVETIARHLDALNEIPAARYAYAALAQAALEFLPNRNPEEISRLLQKVVGNQRGGKRK